MEFWIYLQMGFAHITDLGGYDHILFILSLCAVYQWRDWRKVLVLVTAFTIGHSVTLALAVFNIVRLPKDFIEFLIPVTIVLTAVANVFSREEEKGNHSYTRYFFAMFFGLIHGLGFSNFLRAMLMKSSMVVPLLGFNIGLEIGQLLVVVIVLSLASLLVTVCKIGLVMRDWTNFLSGAAAGIGLILLLNTAFWTKNVVGKTKEEAFYKENL